MAAHELVLIALAAFADPPAPSAPAAPAAPAATRADLYPAVTAAMERGAFADAKRLAATIPLDSTLGRKAAFLARLADTFENAK